MSAFEFTPRPLSRHRLTCALVTIGFFAFAGARAEPSENISRDSLPPWPFPPLRPTAPPQAQASVILSSPHDLSSQTSGPVFFPPYPPPLNERVPPGGPPASYRAAPTELAHFIVEPFYAPLSTRLAKGDLSAKLQSKLDAYRTERAGLLNELRGTLEQLPATGSPARRTTLEALARRQARRLAALEKTADELRQECAGRDDWDAYRLAHSNEPPPRPDAFGEIAEDIRATAYYQDGLSPEQRRLLQEIALEFMYVAPKADPTSPASAYMFFSPDLSRVRQPGNLPAEVTELISDYLMRKSAVKKTLYDAVRSFDRTTSDRDRTVSLKRLAQQQAPEIAALEKLAEEIRRRAPSLAQPPALPTTHLGPVLTERIALLLLRTHSLQADAIQAVEAVEAQYPDAPATFTCVFEPDRLDLVLTPRPARLRRLMPSRPMVGPQPAEVAKMNDEFREEQDTLRNVKADYQRAIGELAKETDEIRDQAKWALGPSLSDQVDAEVGRTVRLAMLQQDEETNRDYRLALFEPGFSPEQRRLLFAAAIEKLNLPLPGTDLPPLGRRPPNPPRRNPPESSSSPK